MIESRLNELPNVDEHKNKQGIVCHVLTTKVTHVEIIWVYLSRVALTCN